MNKYIIEQRVRTLSHLSVGLNDDKPVPEMSIDDFLFTQWDFNYAEGWKGDAWLVQKEVEVNSGIEAINNFRKDLDKIVQKLTFVSQCFMDFYREPFLIFKSIGNQDNVFFYKHIQNKTGVGLQFDESEINAYESIKGFKYPEAFRFLQECSNTIGYVPKLLLLFSALEAMCGKIERQNADGKIYITYDKNEMMKILGCSLYNELFGPNGIRHKLDHGEMVETVFGKDYVNEIYKNIICYFNNNFKTQLDEVVSPQRHFYDNHEFINFWLKPKDNFEVNLKNCIKSFNSKYTMIDGCEYVPNIDISQY